MDVFEEKMVIMIKIKKIDIFEKIMDSVQWQDTLREQGKRRPIETQERKLGSLTGTR